MNIPGPLPNPSVSPVRVSEPLLRVNQRIVAEVVQVSGAQAVLSYEGHPVVARIVTADALADLLPRQRAQFVVEQFSEKEVLLRLVTPKAAVHAGAQAAGRADVAAQLLHSVGQSADPASLLLARAALAHNLLISPDLLAELRAALDSLGRWGAVEANLAAALKAAGLPLTEASLRLAAGAGEKNQLLYLLDALARAARQPGLSEGLRAAAERVYQGLMASLPDLSLPPDRLLASLERSLRLLGRSAENALAAEIEGGTGEPALALLAGLRETAHQQGANRLAQSLDDFFRLSQQNQLLNLRADHQPDAGEWNRVFFGVCLPGNLLAEEQVLPANLQIARKRHGTESSIDPNFTRLVIQVGLGPASTVEVDLAIVDWQVNARVTVTDPAVYERSQQELPALHASLAEAGFRLLGAAVEVGSPHDYAGLSPAMTHPVALQSVDVQV